MSLLVQYFPGLSGPVYGRMAIPEYTWRNKQGQQQARLDYILASEWLAGNTIRSSIRHHPWSITDHSTVVTVFKLVKGVRGLGTFRCLPLLEENMDYSRLVKHTVKNSNIVKTFHSIIKNIIKKNKRNDINQKSSKSAIWANTEFRFSNY